MGMVKKGDNKVVASPSEPIVAASLASESRLTAKENERLERELGRKPSALELQVVSTLWSERCAYKSSRAQVKRLPTGGQHVVHGPGENAGVVDLGDGQVAILRLESHALGADGAAIANGATGVAARVMGDVLAMGGRPLALLDGVLLGRTDSDRTRTEIRSAVSGLATYCQRAQTPGIGGYAEIDPAREGVPELAVMAVGLAARDAVFLGRAAGLGSKVIYVGAVPGAQVAPELDKTLREGLGRVFRSGHIEGAEDIDVGGLAAAAVDLAARGSTGIEIDLDAVPAGSIVDTAALLTSETPQRFLLVAKKGREEAVVSLLTEAGLTAAVIGVVTNTQRFVCKSGSGESSAKAGDKVVVVDLLVPSLTIDAPRSEKPLSAPAASEPAPPLSELKRPDAEVELLRVVGSPSTGSRQWIAKQLENRRDQAQQRSSDASIIAVPADDPDDTVPPKLLALSLEPGLKHAKDSPRTAAQLAVAECVRNIVCSGAEPIGLADAIVTGDPEDPSSSRALAECIEGLREAAQALKVPVVAGHVRVDPQTAPQRVTARLAVIGQFKAPTDRVGLGFVRQADMVVLLGAVGSGNLAGSAWLSARGQEAPAPLSIDLAAELKLQRAVLELARERLLSSAHDVSDGGLGQAIAESCIAGRIGCSVELPKVDGVSELAMLFNEEPSRVVISFPPENREKVHARVTALGVPYLMLGFVGGDTMEIEELLDVPVHVLADSHARALEDLVGH